MDCFAEMDSDSDSDSEARALPFADAFEADTSTYPYGTLSGMASHVTTQDGTTRAAIQLAALSTRDCFIDLGCGVGRVTNLVARTVGCAVVGIDCCEAEVLQARAAATELPEGSGTAKYVTCDIMEMPAVMESQGFAPDRLCIYMHLIPKQVARQELREMLEPWVLRGARVITSVYHPPYWEPAECDETYNLNLYTSIYKGM